MKRLTFLLLAIGTGWLFVDSVAAQHATPRYQDILGDIKAFTQRVQQAESGQAHIDALVDLSQLYLQVISDDRFAKSDVLQGYRRRIASRLRSENSKMVRAASKNKQQLNSYPPMPKPVLQSMVDRHLNLLAQTSGGAAPILYYSTGLNGPSGHFYSYSPAGSMNDVRQTGKGLAGGIIGDNGRELVNLIETILHPDFWQGAGGPGTVYYYQPLRILVVRATTTVHEDLTHFLRRLR